MKVNNLNNLIIKSKNKNYTLTFEDLASKIFTKNPLAILKNPSANLAYEGSKYINNEVYYGLKESYI
jgi:hypothetical protein